MENRAQMIEWIRAEVVGPSRPIGKPTQIKFNLAKEWQDDNEKRAGQHVWTPSEGQPDQEVLYFYQEPPFRKYGVGLLHPQNLIDGTKDTVTSLSTDPLGADPGEDFELDEVSMILNRSME